VRGENIFLERRRAFNMLNREHFSFIIHHADATNVNSNSGV